MKKDSLIIEHRCLFLGREDDYIKGVKEVLSSQADMKIIDVSTEEELIERCYTYEPMLIFMILDPHNISIAVRASRINKYRQSVSVGLVPAENDSTRRLADEQIVTCIVERSGEPRKDALQILRAYKVNVKYGVNLKSISGQMPIVTDMIWNDYSRDELSLRSSISERLDRLGVKRELAGHKYLIAAIALQSATRSAVEPKKLYERVAEYYDTTPLAVEKAIRYAIETAWVVGDIDYQHLTFGISVDENRGKPTNAEFIARLAIDY